MFNQNEMITFANLFTGAKEFYGTTIVGEIKDGKAESTSTCVHETPTPILFLKHLNAELSLGISPLKADNTVEFGAIDIDDYKGDLQDIVKAIWDFDMPICPCYSKSKKLHLYFFFEMGTQAKDAVEVMKWYAQAFACSKKVEIFPKQLERSLKNKAYSWINLPYYNANDEKNHRKMVGRNGELLELTSFCERATRCKWDFQKHKTHITTYPCYDAPPCILTGAILRDVGSGSRNNWLFSAAVYLKLKDEAVDLEEKLTELNESLSSPLPDQELHSTILSSLQRKSYFYMCASLVDRCDKSQCRRLEHGLNSTKTTGLEYGDLEQEMTDPPNYTWVVNGQKMKFETESEVLQQNKFRALCLRYLHIVPRPVNEDTWSKILSKAAKNMIVKVPDTPGNDFSSGSRFFDLVCAFFNDQRRAQNETQLMLGRVWEDKERHEYVFMANALVRFVQETNGFKALNQMEMRSRICDMGAYKEGSRWRMPVSAIPAPETKQMVIDLNDGEGQSNDF